MKKLYWFSILPALLVLPTTVSAAPVACIDNPTSGFLATVVGSGTMPVPSSSTVTCGPVTFSLFAAQDAGNAAGVQIFESGSTYDSATGLATLGFNPNLVATAVQDIHLLFTVNSTVPITSASLGVGGVGGVVSERLCTGPNNLASGNCVNSIQVASLAANSGMTTPLTPLSSAVTTLYAFKDINKAPSTPAQPVTDITSISQGYQTSGVPEPATFALLGGGLLLFAFARRKKRA